MTLATLYILILSLDVDVVWRQVAIRSSFDQSWREARELPNLTEIVWRPHIRP